MADKNGHFVISLDFELHWGVFDSKELKDYATNISNVSVVIPRLIELCKSYDIHLTFATVGFLFSKTKAELIKNNPVIKPTYEDAKYNPYKLMDDLGIDENTDNLHYASTLIDLIKNTGQHEIGTHTYSHYYCLEEGQNKEQFSADLEAALKVSKDKDVSIKSIVFPRNQINNDYLQICASIGIRCYRGNEHSFFKSAKTKKSSQNPMYRLLRLIDTYFNISGFNTYNTDSLKNSDNLINIPSSRFLKPYSNSLKFLEAFKIKRINKAMSHAALHNEIFHLWWHPHNFGINMDENFSQLELIFKHQKKLQTECNFKSITMSALAEKIANKTA